MPRLKLNDRAIERLHPDPDGKQCLYWDTTMVGFGVLVSGIGDAKTYVVKTHGVRRKVGRVGVMTLAEARAAAQELMRSGPRRKPATGPLTLAAALDAYLAAHDLSARTKQDYADGVKRYFGDWLELPLQELTRDMVEARHKTIAADVERRHALLAKQHQALHLRRAERIEQQWPQAAKRHRAKADAAAERVPFSGKGTANKAMRVLRALYNYALDRNPELPPNPVRLRRQWHKIRPRERHLAATDLPLFYKAVIELESPIGRDYLLLLLFTGLRRREAAALRWTDVDLKARTLTIPAERTKADRKLDLPLTDVVHDMLIARRAIGRTEFVFLAHSRSGHIEEPRFYLDQITASCGVKVAAHDLRRTFITIAESCDISPMALQALVNHSPGRSITADYVQMNVERLREPAQRVADRLKQLCGVVAVEGAIRLRG